MPSPEQASDIPLSERFPERSFSHPPVLHETLSRLEQAVFRIHTSDEFRRYLDMQARFHRYSWGNVALILSQYPEATRVAGFATWKALGRSVRRGEKAIRILVPMRRRQSDEEYAESHLFFGTGSVFDISQTEGLPLPQFEVPVLEGQEGQPLYGRLEAIGHSEGLQIDLAEGPTEDTIMGSYSNSERRIRLRKAAPLQMAKTLAHELAHHFGGHQVSNAENETVAEAVAYVVCAHYQLDTGERSFPYIATWSQDSNVLKSALNTIQQLSARIIDSLEKVATAPLPERSDGQP